MGSGAELGIIVPAFVVLAVVMVIIRIRWPEKFRAFGRVPPPDPAHAREFAALRDEDYDLVLKGGAQVNRLNATWPFASLLVSRGQIELRIYRTETIRITRAEVTGLWWVRAGRGLKFRTASGRLDKVTVWPGDKIEKQLADLGWH